MKSLADLGGLVYSTESGRMCPDCRQPVAQCTCRQNKPLPTGDGIVRVSRETKGRGGKAVTVIRGVPAHEAQALAQQLKVRCGSGGTLKQGQIEIQGDHCDLIVAALQQAGYRVKRSGGA